MKVGDLMQYLHGGFAIITKLYKDRGGIGADWVEVAFVDKPHRTVAVQTCHLKKMLKTDIK
jgi:hypothetical protein